MQKICSGISEVIPENLMTIALAAPLFSYRVIFLYGNTGRRKEREWKRGNLDITPPLLGSRGERNDKKTTESTIKWHLCTEYTRGYLFPSISSEGLQRS